MKTVFVVTSVHNDGTDNGKIRLEKVFTNKDKAYFYIENKNRDFNEKGYCFHIYETELEG